MALCENNGGIALDKIAQAVGGKLISGSERFVHGISTDSRNVAKDSLFAAICGERTDGHLYIPSAIASGASAVIAEYERFETLYGALGNKKSELPKNSNIILVDDTVKALGRLAAWYREVLSPFVCAVTGSTGKTTTKELIYAVLSQKLQTHKTVGNYNSLIGLPVTVMDMTENKRAVVLEMGMSAKGEISGLTAIAHPDIAVITNIGSSHIGILGSREAIRDAKVEIAEGIVPGGLLILNGDEPLLSGFKENEALRHDIGYIYVAVNNRDADVVIENVRELTEQDCTVFDLLVNSDIPLSDGAKAVFCGKNDADIPTTKICVKAGTKISGIKINMLGGHLVFDAALAFTAGLVCGIPFDDIKSGLLGFYQNPMRQSVKKRRLKPDIAFKISTDGLSETGTETLSETAKSDITVTVIEDCYNASPESVRMALSVLKSVAKNGRAVAVLGDMRELGEYSAALHRNVGSEAAKCADILFTFGNEALEIACGARDAGMNSKNIFSFTDSDIAAPENAVHIIASQLSCGDTVLIKASRALKLERVAEMLFES